MGNSATFPIHATLNEVKPGSAISQRWNKQRQSWIRPTFGPDVFQPEGYRVVNVAESDAKDFIVRHHYSQTYPAASQRFGLIDAREADPVLVGVAVFSIPTQARVLTNVFPHLEPYKESLELGRFCLLGEPTRAHRNCDTSNVSAPGANAESWFLSQCLRLLRGEGVRGVVSFSDPVPRVVAGRTLFPGHIGTIYQASNATYTGRGTARTLTVLPNGATISDRALQKVRKQERGHEYVEKRLIALGASTLRAGQDPRVWLTNALDQVRAVRLRHAGNHRYALTTSRTERRLLSKRLPQLAYPKQVTEAA